MPSTSSLAPSFRKMARAFYLYARARYPGAGLVITSARRTYQEQARLYQRYLAGQNNGLPATPPGTSDHELGLAFDMARLNHDPLTDPILRELGAAWQRLGGRWWDGDPVHFAAGFRRGRTSRSRRRARRTRR